MKNRHNLDQIIWQVVAAIPPGKVMTYGQVAKLCGYPGYARYVGSTLKKLPDDSTLPWHRVINAKGKISFPPESESYQKQKYLLQKEGVLMVGSRIKLMDYAWRE
ncbi:MGMT family protein [Methylophaga nitratireducenticrescens]|uniref:Methylated DNA-protein cysteine methyltransferase n=1 Tax=Methylophaga nitratireducenticrescens TaxID=754476 RepID=I1XN72_METNJ|nr:MGMT family protein [Methylophaga nitratireducenticrescens]AFI85841.1 cysteine methyltransferase [Methylophaga nitratireducenticrescens]AUZ85550.1 cysteine methyltransferase [Methylophaga nitratireducenticrescens]